MRNGELAKKLATKFHLY